MGIANLLTDERRAPDILDCIANLSSDEIFTPPAVAREVLSLLPDEVWSNPDLRWLDPACKSGVFLREAAARLMTGLAEAIPDEDKRRRHIFERMLWGIAISELTANITRRTLYYTKHAATEHAVVRLPHNEGNVIYRRSSHTYSLSGRCKVCGISSAIDSDDRKGLENYAYTFIHESEVLDMQFDIVVSNPPYQLDDTGFGAAATPIYQHFVDQALKLDPKLMAFIIPARWYAGGKRLDDFRRQMLTDPHIEHLVDYPDASEIFPGVDVKGGICYFLRNKDHTGTCAVTNVINGERLSTWQADLSDEEVFIRFEPAHEIVAKVRARGEETFDKVLSTREPFGFMSNFGGWDEAPRGEALKYYMRGGSAWVDRSKVTKNVGWVDKWKVLIPKASDGSGVYPMQVLGRPIVAPPGSVCSGTYLVAGVFDSEKEANNCDAYLRTRFVRFLVSLRKNTQDLTQDKVAFVPRIDLARHWSDEELYERYELSESDTEFIEAMIKEMPED